MNYKRIIAAAMSMIMMTAVTSCGNDKEIVSDWVSPLGTEETTKPKESKTTVKNTAETTTSTEKNSDKTTEKAEKTTADKKKTTTTAKETAKKTENNDIKDLCCYIGITLE